MDRTNYTARAREAGWQLPEGWTVVAEVCDDDTPTHPRDEYDCYSEDDLTAYDRGDWRFVYVHVSVQDEDGHQWGASGIGGTEYGTLPDAGFVDPLSDTPGEYNVVREYDLIAEALRDAQGTLERFGSPEITLPDQAVDYSGI